MTLKPGCVTCEHVADVRGIDLTQPTPEAVEAVAEACLAAIRDYMGVPSADVMWSYSIVKAAHIEAPAVLAFIRDAIHRDGPDADAVREALGLRWGKHDSRAYRRVVGVAWQEVQP